MNKHKTETSGTATAVPEPERYEEALALPPRKRNEPPAPTAGINPPPSAPPRSLPAQNYTQINVMFPASQVELPSADKFNAFPEPAQEAILAGFRAEQAERHAWLQRQQKNEHELNMGAQRWAGTVQVLGLLSGVAIVGTILWGGIILLKAGASSGGIALIVTALAGLVGTAVYGHRAKAQRNEPKAPAGK